MCSRVRRFVVAVLTLLAAGPLSAQRAASDDARALERVVDTLVRRWRTAHTALADYDAEVARQRILSDTLSIGNLRLLVEHSLRARAESAAHIASPRVDSVAGAAAERLQNGWLAVYLANDSTADTIVVAARNAKGAEIQRIYGAGPDSVVAIWVYSNAIRLLSWGLDVAFLSWLATDLTPDTLSTSAWLGTRLDLVSSNAIVARQCYDGDLAACKVALRLVEPKDPLMEWFDAAGRRRHVERLVATAPYAVRHAMEEADRCLEGVDAACVSVMRSSKVVDPIPSGRRRSLAVTAMQMGGRAGYQRMLTANGTTMDRLVFAAGAPVDSVLSVWLARVKNTRRPSQDMTPGIAFSALGWILVCGALALRSTRWR